MEIKTKQRILGLLVLLSIVAASLSLLFSRPLPGIEKAFLLTTTPASSPAPGLVFDLQQLVPEDSVASKSIPHGVNVANKQGVNTLRLITLKPNSSLKNEDKTRDSNQNALLLSPEMPNSWVVQIGTFIDTKHADQLVAELRTMKVDVFTRQGVNIQGHPITGVYAGPYIKEEQAKSLIDKLRKKINLKGVIRKYVL